MASGFLGTGSLQIKVGNYAHVGNMLRGELWRRFALSGWQAFKACLRREWTLMVRHKFIYIFRTCQARSLQTPYISLSS